MDPNMQGSAGVVLLQLIFFLIGLAIIVIPFWKIYSKAGFSKWLSLLMIVPLINLIVLYVVAFSAWPAQRQDG